MMMKRKTTTPFALSVLASAVLMATPAIAATAAQVPPTATEPAEETGIEVIQVTAQKRAESLQQVSLSVDALSTDFMQKANVRDINDVAVQVPALSVTTNSTPWNTSFRLRRLGNEGNIPTFEPSTGLFIDGAFRSRSGLGLGDLVDIERIEVLKGPQSTLYGKNVTAGVISITTLKPSQDFDAMLESTLASDAGRELKGFVNGGLGEQTAGRLSFSYTGHDPLVKNLRGTGDGHDLGSFALRGQLLIDVSDDLSVRLIGAAVDRDHKGPLGEVEFDAGSKMLINAFSKGTVTLLDNTLGNHQVDFNDGPSKFKQQSHEATAIVDYDLGFASLNAVTAYDYYDVVYQQQDADLSPLDFTSWIDPSEGETWSQELRLTSPGGERWDWMTGLFAMHNTFNRGSSTEQGFIIGTQAGSVGTANDRGWYYNEQSTSSYSVFGSGSYQATEQLELSMGLRYSYENKSALLQSGNNRPGPSLVNVLAPDNHWQPEDSWNFLSGNLIAEFQWTDAVMTYLSYTRGNKAGGFNLGYGGSKATNHLRPFAEEAVNSYEMGIKSVSDDKRLLFNAALFHSDYFDMQSAAFLGLSFNVDSAERVKNQGFEFDGKYRLTPDLSLNFGASYVIAEYEKYSRGSCAPVAGPAKPTAFCDLSGRELPFAPRWKGNIGLMYERAAFGGEIYARTDWAYTGKHTPSSSLDVRHLQDAYSITNLKLGWKNYHWDLSVWGKNVFDEIYLMQGGPDSSIGAVAQLLTGQQNMSQQGFYSRGAVAGLTVRYNFM